MYKLAGISLASFGFEAGLQSGSAIALSGFLDLPSRIGKTFHNWGDENGVEPYVLVEEIMFGGRDLVLVGFIQGTSKQDALNKIDALETFVDGFTDLVPLETKWGVFNVKIGMIHAEYISSGFLSVTINMREPVASIGTAIENTILTPASLQAYGATLLSMKGERYGRPETKQEYFTIYGREGYQVAKTEAPILEIELLFKGNNWTDFTSKVRSFSALLAKEGLRRINMPNDKLREFFVTEGMQVTRVLRNGNEIFGFAHFKAIELEFGKGIRLFVDVNNMMGYQEIPEGMDVRFELNEKRELIMIMD